MLQYNAFTCFKESYDFFLKIRKKYIDCWHPWKHIMWTLLQETCCEEGGWWPVYCSIHAETTPSQAAASQWLSVAEVHRGRPFLLTWDSSHGHSMLWRPHLAWPRFFQSCTSVRLLLSNPPSFPFPFHRCQTNTDFWSSPYSSFHFPVPFMGISPNKSQACLIVLESAA